MIRFARSLLVLVLCACVSSQHAEPIIANAQPARTPSAVDDRDVIIATVLEQFSADPSSMADHGLLPDTGPIYVLAEIGAPVTYAVQPAALPNKLRPFVIKPLTMVQAEADRTNADVAFIRFYKLDVDDSNTRARVIVGVDIVMPGRPNAIKMCCCKAFMRWDKRDGRWRAGDGDGVVCS